MTLRMAMRALQRNPLRTLLTMLGVIIGVGSVITMLAMATGATRDMQDRIQRLGSSVLFVWAGAPRTTGASQGHTVAVNLQPDDARAMVDECSAVKAVSPIDQAQAQCVFQDHNWNTLIVGCGVDHLEVRNLELESGVWFADSDVNGVARVCVLGPDAADELFGTLDPVGEVIRIKGQPFKVLGVVKAKGTSSGGTDMDDRIYIPVTTAMQRIDHQRWIDYAMVSARGDDRIDQATEQITALLRQRHRLRDRAQDDFTIRTQSEIAQQVNEQGKVMTLFLGGVAAISLLVGGIGIMNIMLVSVTERIREIGIRMAIGARGRDIMMQFLAESVVLSGASGLLGIALGMVAARIAASLSAWPFFVSTESIVLAFGFSVLVGVFFGFYPAVKASRLDPIEALRTE